MAALGETIAARDFWERAAALPYNEQALTLPPPRSVTDIAGGSALVVDGTVTGIETVSSEWKADPALENIAGRVVVRVAVAVDRVLRGAGAADGETIYWDVPAWMGDVRLMEAASEDVKARFGAGPKGARVVLLLTPVPREMSSDGSWYVLTGVMDDGATVARLDPGRVAEPTEEFTSAESLSTALSRS